MSKDKHVLLCAIELIIFWFVSFGLIALIAIIFASCASAKASMPIGLPDAELACLKMVKDCELSGDKKLCDNALTCIDLYELAAVTKISLQHCEKTSSVCEQELLGARNEAKTAKTERWYFLGCGSLLGALLTGIIILAGG